MNKFIEWFKNNIFEAFYGIDGYCENECYSIRLFGVFIDFRNYYLFDEDENWYSKNGIDSFITLIKKKNKKRKNQIIIPSYKKIPWYITIIDWRSEYYIKRNYLWAFAGFLIGFILKGLV